MHKKLSFERMMVARFKSSWIFHYTKWYVVGTAGFAQFKLYFNKKEASSTNNTIKTQISIAQFLIGF